MTDDKLEAELCALEAALPFLRQQLDGPALRAHLKDYERQILAGVSGSDAHAYASDRLRTILDEPEVPGGADAVRIAPAALLAGEPNGPLGGPPDDDNA